MTCPLNPCIDEVCWEDVRKEVAKLNFTIARLIDQVEPDAKLKLFQIRYPFGAHIFHQNQLYFPLNSQKLVPINNHQLPSQLSHQLNYSSVPLAFLMNKKVEVFTENLGQVTPMNLINPGELLGLDEFFEGNEKKAFNCPWQMTAGARSIFFSVSNCR